MFVKIVNDILSKCDAPTCIAQHDTFTRIRAEAVQHTRNAGWYATSDGKHTYCPEHALRALLI